MNFLQRAWECHPVLHTAAEWHHLIPTCRGWTGGQLRAGVVAGEAGGLMQENKAFGVIVKVSSTLLRGRPAGHMYWVLGGIQTVVGAGRS